MRLGRGGGGEERGCHVSFCARGVFSLVFRKLEAVELLARGIFHVFLSSLWL